MKNGLLKRILSVSIVTAMGISVMVGCGNKDVKEEEISKIVAFEEPIEILPEKVQEEYKNFGEKLKDYMAFGQFFLSGAENQEYFTKYNTSADELNNRYMEFHAREKEHSTNAYLSYINGVLGLQKDMEKFADAYKVQAEGFMKSALLGKSNDDYKLYPSFEELNPEETIQKLLKDNNIKVESVEFREGYKEWCNTYSPMYITFTINIKGTQDGAAFDKDVDQSFFFTPNQETLDKIEKDEPIEMREVKSELVGIGLYNLEELQQQ